MKSLELNKTKVERNYSKMVEQFFPKGCIGVTLDYSHRLNLLRQYLQNVYGNLADWHTSLENYLSVLKEDKKYNNVFSIDDIELVSEDVLKSIIAYDELMDQLANEAKICVEKWKSGKDFDALIRACSIFGILPLSRKGETLNHFLVNFPTNEDEATKLQAATLSNPSHVGFLGMAADMLSIAYNDQYFATFPIMGTLITQPKRVSYYRGENAYYRTSRPSFYRSKHIQKLPKDLQAAILTMKYDECGCLILDRFKVIVDWCNKVSDCNLITIMQHYGMPTGVMDLTSDFKVAFFCLLQVCRER